MAAPFRSSRQERTVMDPSPYKPLRTAKARATLDTRSRNVLVFAHSWSVDDGITCHPLLALRLRLKTGLIHPAATLEESCPGWHLDEVRQQATVNTALGRPLVDYPCRGCVAGTRGVTSGDFQTTKKQKTNCHSGLNNNCRSGNVVQNFEEKKKFCEVSYESPGASSEAKKQKILKANKYPRVLWKTEMHGTNENTTKNQNGTAKRAGSGNLGEACRGL